MLAMKTCEECKVYQAQHHVQMAERAKARGQQLPPMGQRDPCAGLKP